MPDSGDVLWIAVIARSLALLCLERGEQQGKFKTKVERVEFLESLGIPTPEAASMVGSTKASIDELRRQARKKGLYRGKGK